MLLDKNFDIEFIIAKFEFLRELISYNLDLNIFFDRCVARKGNIKFVTCHLSTGCGFPVLLQGTIFVGQRKVWIRISCSEAAEAHKSALSLKK